MKPGQKVRIVSAAGTHIVPETYLICGAYHERGLWLSVNQDDYDGYDADIIIQEREEEGAYLVMLQDRRSALPDIIYLQNIPRSN